MTVITRGRHRKYAPARAWIYLGSCVSKHVFAFSYASMTCTQFVRQIRWFILRTIIVRPYRIVRLSWITSHRVWFAFAFVCSTFVCGYFLDWFLLHWFYHDWNNIIKIECSDGGGGIDHQWMGDCLFVLINGRSCHNSFIIITVAHNLWARTAYIVDVQMCVCLRCAWHEISCKMNM